MDLQVEFLATRPGRASGGERERIGLFFFLKFNRKIVVCGGVRYSEISRFFFFDLGHYDDDEYDIS